MDWRRHCEDPLNRHRWYPCEGAGQWTARAAQGHVGSHDDAAPDGRRGKEAHLRLELRCGFHGLSGPVVHLRPIAEPKNLGGGWVGFNFRKAFGKPVRILNDAAMQALGSYQGGRMLFLGLGTGLGSAMIVDGILEPMEIAHLPYKKGKTYEDFVGLRGLERLRKKRWRRAVADVVSQLTQALEADYVVLGGGNAKLLDTPPKGARLGDNANAFRGGFLLWKDATKTRPEKLRSPRLRS
jgi:polyphosphate glucokinase